MKRNVKNLIMIVIIVAVGVASYFTMKDVKETQESNQPSMGGQPPVQMQDNSSSNSNNNMNSSNNMSEPPEKPDSQSSGTNQQNPPEKPDSQQEGTNKQNQTEMPNAQQQANSTSTEIQTIQYIMFGVEGFAVAVLIVYLIMSKFNKLTWNETLETPSQAILYAISVIVITAVLIIAQTYITQKVFVSETQNMTNNTQNNMQMIPEGGMNSSSASVTKSGAMEVDGETKTLSDTYTTSEADESAILVENGGSATISGATITKTGGDSSNTENSEFYGVNSGVLVTENSTATIKNATISTNAKGSNVVFSTGTDSKIYISDSTITTTGSSSSRGLDATYGGYIEADNVTITTQGGSCATLATDRGEGTVIAQNSKLETNGTGSPVIYSTGDISIENTQGVANGSQMVVIEGKNSATVTNSTLTASGTGNRGETDQAGVMIYQSMSGDAGEGTGTFTATDSNLSIQTDSKYYKTVPMFFVTNTDAIINLTNTKLSYGSNILVSCKGTSEWGTSGSNGGNLTLNATNQTLAGDIEIDKISTLVMNLTSSSSYEGTINADNTAKDITLKLDATSSITLTGDSYVTSLDDADTSYSNINFNGYKLYVNGVAISI